MTTCPTGAVTGRGEWREGFRLRRVERPRGVLMDAAAAQPQGALVLGGDYRALGVVRSLGRRGVPVWVVRQGDDSLAVRSRYASRRLPWPEEAGEDEQVEALLAIAR